MSETGETLVRMANQIAANLMHEADPAAATAEHIRLFWDPRMKAMILDSNISGLNEMAEMAIKKLIAEN